MESNQFLQLLDEIFIPNNKKIGGYHILLLDGQSTQVSLSVALKCKKNNITLIYIPAHLTHILKPLDVGIFCHVKDVV